MDSKTEELLASIRGLARTIRKETQLPVGYSEKLHCPAAGSPVDVTVSVRLESGQFQWWHGSENPISDLDTTIEVMHEQMLAWVVARRKEKAA